MTLELNTEFQLTDLFVDNEKYNRWIYNCMNNKSHRSWIYFFEGETNFRRQVILVDHFCNIDWPDRTLIYKGKNKHDWGIIKPNNQPEPDIIMNLPVDYELL